MSASLVSNETSNFAIKNLILLSFDKMQLQIFQPVVFSAATNFPSGIFIADIPTTNLHEDSS